jgi:hypothetical protein
MPSEEQTYRDMVEDRFDKQDKILEEIRNDGKETKMQVKYTNGRVTRLELRMAIAFTAIAVIIILKFPELVGVLKLVGI